MVPKRRFVCYWVYETYSSKNGGRKFYIKPIPFYLKDKTHGKRCCVYDMIIIALKTPGEPFFFYFEVDVVVLLVINFFFCYFKHRFISLLWWLKMKSANKISVENWNQWPVNHVGVVLQLFKHFFFSFNFFITNLFDFFLYEIFYPPTMLIYNLLLFIPSLWFTATPCYAR